MSERAKQIYEAALNTFPVVAEMKRELARCNFRGAFMNGAEWADRNPCQHSWEPDTAMTMMHCEWCGIEADKTSEKNQLRAELEHTKIMLQAARFGLLKRIIDELRATPDQYIGMGYCHEIADYLSSFLPDEAGK